MLDQISVVMANLLDSLFSQFFVKLATAIIIILVGFIIGRILGKIVEKVLHEIELNRNIRKATKVKVALEEILSHFVSYVVYFIAVVMALKGLGLATDILNIISAAVMVIIVLSIFLGIKDFIPNLISGLFIHQKGFIKVGDHIKFKNIEGQIIYINLVETRVQTKNKDIIYIPNSNLTKGEIIKVKKK